MSLLTSGGKSLGMVKIGNECIVDFLGHRYVSIYESGYKHGSFRGRGGQLWPFTECLYMG